MSSFAKVIGTIGLLALAILGLAMSLCGGAFTLSSFGSGAYAAGFLVISLPSLLIGLLFLWLAIRKLKRRTAPPGRIDAPPESRQ